jgi:uncharacterized protein YjbJ (UPF0337 family)
MDENRVTGTAKNLGGKVEEGLGRMTGDAQTQFKGQAEQVAGAAEDLYRQAKDADAVKRGPEGEFLGGRHAS